jgi:recombination protein RecA
MGAFTATPVSHPEASAALSLPADLAWNSLITQKLVEISGTHNTARFSTAVAMVLGAQRSGETVAWIQPEGGRLYPPDLHDSGVDLRALAVIHTPRHDSVQGLKAAEILLRSGGFGMVVLDLIVGAAPRSPAWQGRLLGLARQHHSSVVLLTHKPSHADSLGALVSLRVEPQRQSQHDLRMFEVAPQVLKNKMGLALPLWMLQRRGPTGLW